MYRYVLMSFNDGNQLFRIIKNKNRETTNTTPFSVPSQYDLPKCAGDENIKGKIISISNATIKTIQLFTGTKLNYPRNCRGDKHFIFIVVILNSNQSFYCYKMCQKFYIIQSTSPPQYTHPSFIHSQFIAYLTQNTGD